MIKFFVYFRLYLLAGLILSFSACKNEDGKEINDKTTNKWIENTMRSYYYWYGEIPETKKLNFETSPELFFQSLLSKKDGKDNNQVSGGHYYYSTIKKKTASTRSYLGEEPSLGFEFQNWQLDKEGTRFAVNVLYVLPGSPAALGGIKRGDWIHQINGAGTNGTNIYDLLGSKSVTLEVSDSYANRLTHTVELVPALIEDNPVLYAGVFQDESTGGKKIGYLVYNHFTSGPDGDDDKTYDEGLRRTFGEFKTAGVEEFILDLRYNGGGLVTSAQLLASELAPASALGKTFCDLKYNDKQDKTMNYKLESSGQNLDLPRLLILTGTRTASASEAVINGLRPYYDVILLGEKTEGKNVGSITLSSEKYGYDLHPIVCRIYNSKGESEYDNGFSPDWPLMNDDRMILGHIELGDKERDILLNVAVYKIAKGSFPPSTFACTVESDAVSGYSSLERRSENGMRVPF